MLAECLIVYFLLQTLDSALSKQECHREKELRLQSSCPGKSSSPKSRAISKSPPRASRTLNAKSAHASKKSSAPKKIKLGEQIF